jgi:hypothetical protein
LSCGDVAGRSTVRSFPRRGLHDSVPPCPPTIRARWRAPPRSSGRLVKKVRRFAQASPREFPFPRR